jgi:hypothetical protein
VRFGIVAVLVLTDPEIKCIAGHERFDTAPAGRATIIERQIAIDNVGNEIGPPHRQTAHRIRLDIVLVFVEIVGAGKAVAELIRTVENRVDAIDQIHQIGRGRAGKEQGRRRAGIDDAVHRIHRN